MKKLLGSLLIMALQLCALPLGAQQPFLSEPHWTLMRDESSGVAPYETVRILARLHRVPGTPEFDQAAEVIAKRAVESGLSGVSAEQFPIDGKIAYGLMRSHLGWTAGAASLWQIVPDHRLLADASSEPIRLADYSHSADLEAPLVDVGTGTQESDYAGKDVKGKIVLADGVLAIVQRLAVMTHGAAGIVSDMPNQTTAWSGLDPSIVRWGHLDASLPAGFAFMVSRATAQGLRAQLSSGQSLRLSAHVVAEIGPGHWTVVSAVIPGSDATAGEVVFSCHLDHQRPGANDNASGCATILESGRLLARLIGQGRLAPPKRTLRFIWGPEVEGTMAYLSRHDDVRRALTADIHMDMVGGDLFKDKAVLHVTETPWSLPSFVTDLGEQLAQAIKQGAARYTEEGGDPAAAVLEASGTRNGFFVDRTPYAEGSDHDDYDSSTIAVPSLYLRDWPDINIHTDHDTLDQLDATKLRRVALLGAAAGYSLANLDASQAPILLPWLAAKAEQRLAASFERAQTLLEGTDQAAWFEARNLMHQALQREQAALAAFGRISGTSPADLTGVQQGVAQQAAAFTLWLDRLAHAKGAVGAEPGAPWAQDPAAAAVPQRIGAFGPLTYQNDDVLLDRLGRARLGKITLLDGGGSRLLRVQDQGALYAYEIVNFVDGRRSVGEIRDAVAAEFGPIPLAVVADYLAACAEAKVIAWR
jgi:hypothetical protein